MVELITVGCISMRARQGLRLSPERLPITPPTLVQGGHLTATQAPFVFHSVPMCTDFLRPLLVES